MLNYSLGKLKDILRATLLGSPDNVISSVSIDSRSVSAGPNSLFFAIVGGNHDGHQFIGDLYARGVRSFVVSHEYNYSKLYPEGSFLIVNNTLQGLQQLAAYHRSQFRYPVVGITGSNGKTIVKEWISQLLASERKIVRSPRSFNSQVGVPLSVLQMDSSYDLGIFEAGISCPGEMESLEQIISPDIGIFTNLGAAHQENFMDLLSKAGEKFKLFARAEVLIYCKDYQSIHTLALQEASKRKLHLFTWSKKADADIQLKEVRVKANQTEIIVKWKNKRINFTIPFTDYASNENAMHCLCTLIYMGTDINSIPYRMGRLLPVAMRLEQKEGINGCTLVNDSYNSDIGSLSVALDFLSQQRQHSKKILILSDILQSGMVPETLYSEVAQLVGSRGIDYLIGIGPEITKFSHKFSTKSQFFSDTQSFLHGFSRNTLTNAAILLKGSRSFQFEQISQVLEQKTHRTLLEINLNALVHNLNYFRGLLNPEVKIMAMVKAFSYGSGSYEIASLLQYHRVDYLGVAFADEGVALREAGINLPIVVLNPAFGSYELMIDYNLEPEIFSFSSLESFALALNRKAVDSYAVHLKIDTGMHRLGFMEGEIDALCHKLSKLSRVRVKSILSHLVATDESEHDVFTLKQIEQFKEITDRIIKSIGYKPMVHILNSAGIERFPQVQFDMVRLGIGLYGVSAFHRSSLLNVSTLKTFVAQIRTLNSGETIGYSRKGKVERVSKIATIPIGYADGLNRKLSNGVGEVLVSNSLAPIIGNISMDTCMIDITDIPGIEEGDEVIVFGDKPSISQIANALETIPYEVLTSISRRVKRVYIQE